MKLERVEIVHVAIPLVTPFRTSFGTMTAKDTFLLRVVTDAAEGWSEFAADPEPLYCPEFVAGAEIVLRDFLLPRVAALPHLTTAALAPATAKIKGHELAKAALETAVLDAELRSYGMPLATYLGAVRDRVPAGVSVGIKNSVPELLDDVERYLAEGYVRIKLKIEPGWDLEPVRAVRERFGADLPLQVDANTAYGLGDAEHLRRLDEFGLLLIEEPLEENNLHAHARLQQRLATPVCLDESLHHARDTASAIAMDACRVVNVKPARVGGYLEARRVHDVAHAHGVPVWCGGMLETGIGRAPNLALAALPGCTLPGDTSASSRYFAEDITEPFVLEDGHLPVPATPGIGIEPLPDALRRFTRARRDLYDG
ncbi:O-succinylbenzoate synthase [Streptomyces griseochromogenes]|uniref:o-succinylbenzoate synthase n=1 Tax=Streptomyces griseochromogenes TaxID=68214 RepID=A0A1B1B958_9ACTN|nr:o-succinylbenzoate synthase [Streptomyces griseochromogenes]ANP55368.1 o-succinylbenzoate synthase [Streptomyces griseochromogenes]MBP2054401.1 O-succinylbenzoate synthase [Streptomyces griseochromogenes]